MNYSPTTQTIAKQKTVFTVDYNGNISAEILFDVIIDCLPYDKHYDVVDFTGWADCEPMPLFKVQYRLAGHTFTAAEFEKEDDANQYLLDLAYGYYCEQCEVIYYDSFNEANEARIERTMDGNRPCSREVSTRYWAIVDATRSRWAAEAEAEERARIVRKEAATQAAKVYAAMIPHVEGEDYKATCKRLSDAIGTRIGSQEFNLAVKLIRKNK